MRRQTYFAVFLAVIAAVTVTILLWPRVRDVRRIVRPEGEFIVVKDKYAIVILSPAMMNRTFGPKWDHLSLFYGLNRGVTPDGERAAIASSPLRPLAKGIPVLIISGGEWRDLIVPIYALETRQQTTLSVDIADGSVTVLASSQPRVGNPHVSSDGRLFFQ
jgi:hypothetical protein